jgi:hypothetical protein
MTRSVLVILLVLGLWAAPVYAQIPVIDGTNLIQNTIQAVQAVLMVANQILELTPVDEVILGEEFNNDMGVLGTLLEDAQGLATDLASIQSQITALYGLNTAPTGTRALVQRLTAIRALVWQQRLAAIRTRVLLQTTQRAIQRLQRILSTVGSFVGNMYANQTLAQLETTITEHLAKMQAHTEAFSTAEQVDKLTDPLLEKSLENITEAVSADYPRAR